MAWMRIVAVADTHTFEADLGTLPDGDVFVHAGDLVRAGTLDELAGVAAWIRALPHRHKIVVAGNHDWCFVHERSRACAMLGTDVIYLQDQAAVLDGVRFWGSPWQPAYNGWAFNLPRGRPLAEKWAQIPHDIDVLITHGPPEGIGDSSSMGGRQGCADLLAGVHRARPAVHLFGHIHQDGGFWQHGDIAFANVTTWECERAPTVLDYDPATRTARAVAVPPRETYR
jgi:predicted phosphohydrolase